MTWHLQSFRGHWQFKVGWHFERHSWQDVSWDIHIAFITITLRGDWT